MADTIKASTGWGGSIQLHNGSSLYELKNVTGFTPPSTSRERVDVTHLKSPNQRREYIPGMYEDAEFSFGLHYRPGTDTDSTILGALNSGGSRQLVATIPLAGSPNVTITCDVVVTSYTPDEVTPGEAMTATVTCVAVGAPVQAAAV